MMPNPNATWADAKKAFKFQKSIGNLRGGRYMGLTEKEIMAKPSKELIFERGPGFKNSDNYLSRPLYIAYSPDSNGIDLVRGLISCDKVDLFFSVDGKWNSATDHDIPVAILESTVCRVPDSRRNNTVSSFKMAASWSPDVLAQLTHEELKEKPGPHEKYHSSVQSFAKFIATVKPRQAGQDPVPD